MAHTPDPTIDPARMDVLKEMRDLLRTEAGETNLAAMVDASIERGILNWGQIFGIDGAMQLNYNEGIRCWIVNAPLISRAVGGASHRGLWQFKFQVYQLGQNVEKPLDFVTETAQELERVFYKGRRLTNTKALILRQLGFAYPDPVADDDGKIGVVVDVDFHLRKHAWITP